MQYSDNSGLGSELAGESDFEREDLDFTTEEGSDQFSRAETPIESMSRLMSAQKQSVQDSRPTKNNIKVKETNLTQTKQSKKSQKKKNKTQKKPEKNPSKKTDKKTKMSK